MTKENRFPPGWDEKRVREVLEHYEPQNEDEALDEDDRLLAVDELASLSLPVASPAEMEVESCPTPDDLLAVSERALGSHIGHLRGRIELPPDSSAPWRQQLRKRNWRP